MYTQAEWRRYVTVFCGIGLLVTGAVATLNYRVDPYLTHQWDTPHLQRLLPGREKLSPWGKTYALARFQPQVLYVGNSRTELGLPVRTALFGERRVFNAALSGASLGDAAAMVRHAAAVSRVETVVWGIDAPSFSMEIGNTDFDRALVAADRHYFLRRGLINLKRAISIDMTLDSIRVLRGTFGQICQSSLALYGQRDGRCVRDRIDSLGGASAAILPRVRDFERGAGPTADAMQELNVSVASLCLQGTRLRLYVNPTHAMTSDALYWAGKWPAMEAWQAQLAELADRHRRHGCDVRVFDFSGFNSVTSEAPPQVSGLREMRNYWETSHYRERVGAMVLARMFGQAGGDFGVELTPATMAQHQAAQRLARDRYHTGHPVETALIRKR
ncbi:hypothetical protein GJ697_01180 [Pseudoduganella sp. FT25W]|uniref:Uncharacterized protein n=1 Tax=Duganella alba TaxID=2666081 RepID=A0A6L5Q9E6_9BURK|nr:hypothetical protein [Duganella alba]MRX06443.1 hypothetical protein [Duganella alba]MRX14837.1 hypothetical protein [Duganella alba]